MSDNGPFHQASRGATLPIVISILIGLAFFFLFFWPIPLHLGDSIVENTQPPGWPAQVGPVSPGDPLQLMHHFWKFTDMLSGHTPWFHNIYEFNAGDDADRFEPSSYYFPFSLFFAIGYWIHGFAFGWNLASILAIVFTVWLTFLLSRRYTFDDQAAWICTILALALPYRWLTLGGGSPTGFAMAWIPLLLLGIERLVRDRSIAGGVMTGLAILLASFSDAHSFFFSVIATPAWFLVAWIHRLVAGDRSCSGEDIRATLSSGTVIAAFFAAAYGLQKLMTQAIGESDNADGRSLREVGLFTPNPAGLFSRAIHGVSEHVYIGYALIAMLILAVVVGVTALKQKDSRKNAAMLLGVLLLVASGAVLCIILSLGMKGPFGGQFFLWARDLIPPYRMIRQPSKIYCLLPSLIAVMAALTYRLVRLPGARSWMVAWLLVIGAGITEAYLRVTPKIGHIPAEQIAYAAVAEDAKAHGRIPRAMVITLWPGESHYSSIYQHWVSQYHIRMVNGYFPFIPKEYVDDVFRRLSSLNLGILDEEQAEWLLARDIRYVLMHENIYPAKVSPFPAGYALARLLEHPRLALLAQHGSVYAFRLLDDERTTIPNRFPPEDNFWPGARATEAERLGQARGHQTEDLTASRGSLVAMREPGQGLIWPGWDLGPGVQVYWGFRVRGEGRLFADRKVMNQPAGTVELSVASTNWTWVYMAMPYSETHQMAHVEFRLADGFVDVDMALLLGGKPVELEPGQTWTIPAAHLFRSGSSSPRLEEVVFDPVIEPVPDQGASSLNGPNVPFAPGRYELSVDFDTPAPAGSEVGLWDIQAWRGTTIASAPMIAGRPFHLDVVVEENLPLETMLQLKPFTHAVTVRALTLKRID